MNIIGKGSGNTWIYLRRADRGKIVGLLHADVCVINKPACHAMGIELTLWVNALNSTGTGESWYTNNDFTIKNS